MREGRGSCKKTPLTRWVGGVWIGELAQAGLRNRKRTVGVLFGFGRFFRCCGGFFRLGLRFLGAARELVFSFVSLATKSGASPG